MKYLIVRRYEGTAPVFDWSGEITSALSACAIWLEDSSLIEVEIWQDCNCILEYKRE